MIFAAEIMLQQYNQLKSLAYLAAACLAGCSTDQMIQTTSLPDATPVAGIPPFKAPESGHGLQGIFYSLPKAVIPITVSVSSGADSSNKDASAGATASPNTSNTPNATPSKSAGKNQSSSSPSATATASPTINLTIQNAPAPLVAKPDETVTKSPNFKLTATAGSPTLVRDSSQNYFLQYIADNFADDTVSLQADENGLLASSNAQSVDETGAIGGSVVQLAVQVAKLAAAPLWLR